MKTMGLVAFIVWSAATAIGLPADQLYRQHCADCHGIRFQGSSAQSLVDGIWQFGEGEEAIARNIRQGIEHLGMPGYRDTLSEFEITALTRFLIESEKDYISRKGKIPTSLETLDYDIDVEIFAEGLEVPWSIAFLDKDTALVTERPGRLRVIVNGRLSSKPVKGTPKVLAEGQGGLLAVAFDPDYAEEGNQWVYLAYSHGLDPEPNGKRPGAMTRLVRGRINGNDWTDEQILFEAPHDTYRSTRHHYGTRMVFDEKKNLYFAIGERGFGADAQNLSKPNGKIHRILRNGGIPRDNPFRHIKTAMPSIYSYGHRNPQGLALHPATGRLWESEHGPKGGDEINLIQPGKNYGWPIITYGINYNDTPITDIVRKEGMEQPVFYWRPSTATCGLDFYHGDLFPKWNNKLLVGALKYEDVRLLDIENDRVMHEEIILENAGRVRDVVCGPDDAVYVILNDPGTILRLVPKKD